MVRECLLHEKGLWQPLGVTGDPWLTAREKTASGLLLGVLNSNFMQLQLELALSRKTCLLLLIVALGVIPFHPFVAVT